MVGSRVRVITLLLFTFVAGTAAGIAADRLNLVPRVARAEEGEAESREEGRDRFSRQTMIERFADDLGLTADQRTEIEAILDNYRSSLRDVWSDMRPQYRSLVDSARIQIEAALTEDQVAQYRELLESRHNRGGRGPSPDGGRQGEKRNDRARPNGDR